MKIEFIKKKKIGVRQYVIGDTLNVTNDLAKKLIKSKHVVQFDGLTTDEVRFKEIQNNEVDREIQSELDTEARINEKREQKT